MCQKKKTQTLTTMHASKNTVHNGSNRGPIYSTHRHVFFALSIHKCWSIFFMLLSPGVSINLLALRHCIAQASIYLWVEHCLTHTHHPTNITEMLYMPFTYKCVVHDSVCVVCGWQKNESTPHTGQQPTTVLYMVYGLCGVVLPTMKAKHEPHQHVYNCDSEAVSYTHLTLPTKA